MSHTEDLVVTAFDSLIALEIPFLVSGSLASNFYGVPRATQDADFVLELNKLPIDELRFRLRRHFEFDTQIGFETVMGSRRLVAHALEGAFDIEFFDLTDDPHDRQRFDRRKLVELLGRPVALPTAEDVIVNKLRWWRRAQRRKDFDDARNVLAVQQDRLDRQYLTRWCDELGLAGALADIAQSL